jgi:DUF4097 and DUF4098 domain-containing protein YvlB
MEERIEETFVVGEAARLSVSNVRGSVTVHGDERDDIRMTAVKRLEGRGDPEHTEVQMRQEGDRVVVKTRYSRDRADSTREADGDEEPILNKWLDRLCGARVCAVDYTILIPAQCRVEIHQVKGTVQVTGVTGRVKVNAVQGVVKLGEIDGRTKVSAISATVEGEGWRGRAEIDTVSGPVQVATAQLARFKANTVSGDLALETTVDDAGHYDFKSVSGDVTFCLPTGRGVESRGSTISGRLRCDLPHEFTRHSRGGWRATINGGGPPVSFNSVSGDLLVRAAGPAQS